MSKKMNATLMGLVAVTLASKAPFAQAESVDYATLEQLFGESVTTSATGKPQRASEAPVAMIIITADQIKHAASPNIPGILKEYTDLDVLNEGRGQSDVNARGFNQGFSGTMLVLVNGRQVFQDWQGYTNWDAIPVQLAEIRQIEVVKGPNSALFGFNAAAGVINIVTVNPLYDSVNAVTVTTGSEGYREASAVGTVKLGDFGGIRLSAGGYDAHEFDQGLTTAGLDGTVLKGALKRNLSLDSQFQVSDIVQAGFEATYYDTNHLDLDDANNILRLREVGNSLKATTSIQSSLGLIDAQIYRNAVYASYYTTGSQANAGNVLTSAKVQDLFKLGANHTFRIAAEVRNSDSNSYPMNVARLGYNDSSLSAMWTWAITPGITLTSALRYDYLGLYYDGTVTPGSPYTVSEFKDRVIAKPTGNSGLVYKITDQDSLRLEVGRALRLPSTVQYAASIPYALVGNPTINPTIVTSYEAGYTRDIRSLNSKLTSGIFYETYENLESVGVSFSLPLPWHYSNIGNANGRGWESSFNGSSDNWRWGLNYRLEFVTEDLSVSPAIAAIYPQHYAADTPHQLITAHVGYTLDDWSLDLFGHYQTAIVMAPVLFQSTAPVSVNPGVTLDARVGYKVNDWLTASISAVDAQSKSTVTTSSLIPVGRQVYFTLGSKF